MKVSTNAIALAVLTLLVEMFRLIPNAQLAVLPGADHFGPVAQANLVARMVTEFFEAPMPKVSNKPA